VVEFAVGSVVAGKDRIDRVIGEGGLGVVVAAHHAQLEQSVAIKYLKPEASQRPATVERFLREARLAARIRSEHVVRVFDVATLEDGTPYIVMECLEGDDLATFLERDGRLPLTKAVDVVLQACEALAEAHSIGIVHRDLKPENLFLARRAGGTTVVKVLDFGISKAAAVADESTRSRKLTQQAELLGTPAYMSPEQLRSSDVDMRADIWSLGVVLQELLTGKLPFVAPTMPQMCAAIFESAPTPLAEVRPDLPPDVAHVVARCLQKDREARYRNVAELAQELLRFGEADELARVEFIRRVITEGGASIRPPSMPLIDLPDDDAQGASSERAAMTSSTNGATPPPRARRRALVALLAVGAVVLIGAAAFVLGPRLRAAPPLPASASSAPDPVADGGAPSTAASSTADAATSAIASASATHAPSVAHPKAPSHTPKHTAPTRTTHHH
jgi:serine/threonine-protein kinase